MINLILDFLDQIDPDMSILELLGVIEKSEFAVESEVALSEFIVGFYKEYEQFPSRQLIDKNLDLATEPAPPLSFQEMRFQFDKIVFSRKKLRLSGLYQEASQQILQGEDPKGILKEIKDLTEMLQDDSVIELKTFDSLSISDLLSSKKTSKTYDFGVEDLDKTVKGIEAGSLVTIAAFTGSFKTTFALSMAIYNAKKDRSSVMLTLEMPSNLLKMIALSNFSFQPEWRGDPIVNMNILKNELSEEERETFPQLEKAFEDLPGSIAFVSPSDVRPSLLEGFENLVERAVEEGFRVLIIDHIQLVKYYARGRDAVNAVDSLVQRCQQMVSRLKEQGKDFSIILMSQVNRENYKKASRVGGRYNLTALAEYNELERSSSYVVFLYSNEELKTIQELRIQLSKHRFGPTIEEPISVFCEPSYSVVGGVSAMESFESTEDDILDIAGDVFGF